jgi:AraC-like DNA-binding protein
MGSIAAEGCRLQAFHPPYEGFDSDVAPILESREVAPGRALIWWLQDGPSQRGEYELLSVRPAGLPLIVLLPSADAIRRTLPLLSRVVDLFPRAILPAPYLGTPEYLRQVLATPPRSLSDAVIRYLTRRGVLKSQSIDKEIRRIFELAPEVGSVTRLARRMYTSRRTIGRHFALNRLPVPSHWLQFARLLHVSIQLQNESAAAFRIATRAGYPDGFTMSNQMKRMIGYRPTEVRTLLGWEWIVEAWLRREQVVKTA